MGQRPQSVSIGDIADINAFVSAVVRKLCLTLHAEERAELEAEGIAIMYGLAADWDGRGTFVGYASSLLDKRLRSAWHDLDGHSRQSAPKGVVFRNSAPPRPVGTLRVFFVTDADIARRVCVVCGDPIHQPESRGRRRRTCTDRCRMQLYRSRKVLATLPATSTSTRRWVKPTVSLDGEMARPGFSERHLRALADFQRVPVAA